MIYGMHLRAKKRLQEKRRGVNYDREALNGNERI